MTCWASVDQHARVAGDDRREDSSSQLKCPSPGNRECHSGCRYYDQNGDRGCEHRDPGCEPCDERISRALRAPCRAGTVGIAGRKSMGIELSSKGKCAGKARWNSDCSVGSRSPRRSGLAESLRVAHEAGALRTRDLKRVTAHHGADGVRRRAASSRSSAAQWPPAARGAAGSTDAQVDRGLVIQ